MDQARISELSPELPAIESKHFRATATLIWPYSSSARQFALLLAEPDVRLRRKNGQVRARFSGASAKAVATTGVGIGDEVVLSLRGAEFVKEGAVSTPGRSIEWELSYVHTVTMRVYRNGVETASLELVDVAPSPVSASPARRPSTASPASALQFSSPAFLKRARLSDGPSFQAPYDPLADETEEGHDKKRRRKSYRDWKAWTYSARTPSPEKEDVTMEDELESAEASPSRTGRLPRTPVSPQQPEMLSVAAGPLQAHQDEPTEPDTPTDTDNYDLYAGPNEHSASAAQYAFGGDTEIDTEVNTEEESATHGELNAHDTSATEADTDELKHVQLERVEENVVEIGAVASAHSHVKNELAIAMPPPTSSTFPAVTAGLLTPIGREPASPKLVPQDASNLPMPSPFPGDQDAIATSYFSHTATGEQPLGDDAVVEDGQDLPSEASYIGETSFFSSIGSSRASVFHPNHESAFTPVRFTFGMDGAGFSRPLDLSSPPPEARLIEEQPSKTEAEDMSRLRQSIPESEPDEAVEDSATADSRIAIDGPGELEVVELSPKDEEDGVSETEMDSVTAEQPMHSISAEQPEEGPSTTDDLQSRSEALEETDRQELATGKLNPTATSAIVDLGPPSDDDEVEPSHEQQQLQPSQRTSTTQDQSPTMDVDSHSEFVNLDLSTEDAQTLETTVEQTVTHTQSQEPEPDVVSRHMEEDLSPDGHPSGSIFEATDDYLQDAFPMEHSSFVQEHEQVAGLGHNHQSDIKVESIEEVSISQSNEFNTHLGHENSAHAATESASQQYPTAPEDDQKPGSVDILPESPAKSTRPEAKTAASPKKGEASVSMSNTQPKGSLTSIAHPAVSPPRKRTRSALSPSQESTQTSPYSLRSQSRQFSPAEGFSAEVTATRKGLPKNASQSSVNSVFDFGTLQTQDHDQSVSSFQPSQELGASQGRYSDVAFVKDSEEESVRSEHTISTVHPSDDMGHMHHSDPVDRATNVREDEEDTKPPPATAPELRRSSRKTKGKKPDSQVIAEVHSNSPARPGSSHATQPLHSSPGMQRREARSQENITPSPRNVRRTRRRVYESDEFATPNASQRADEQISFGEGEDNQGIVDVDDFVRSSPPGSPTIDQRTKNHSKKPITPSVTQQTAMDSQPSVSDHQEQDTLLTPQLTQTTSAALRSFEADNVANTEAIAASLNPQTTAISPTLIDASSDDADNDTLGEPSVGLSTPLAYYTPLKDLLYFLNRSSQFHSAANPDVIALVTSPTTPSEKAKKGPKHWFTTLQITDASSWPQTTTVQIFRAHQIALPEAQVGDVILLRAFAVKSLNRHPTLTSADESAWCVWRWGRPIWGAKRGAFGELRAREETKGPVVERGEEEWREVEKLRKWYAAKVQSELVEKEEGKVKTRSKDKGKAAADGDA